MRSKSARDFAGIIGWRSHRFFRVRHGLNPLIANPFSNYARQPLAAGWSASILAEIAFPCRGNRHADLPRGLCYKSVSSISKKNRFVLIAGQFACVTQDP